MSCCPNPIHCILPPYLLDKLADSTDAKVRDLAIEAIARSATLRAERTTLARMPMMAAIPSATGKKDRLVYDMTPRAFREDVRRAKGALESIVGAPVHGYRAPSYSVTPQSLWALDVLVEEGFRYDASIFPIHHDRYGIPVSPRHPYRLVRGAVLIEAPASTVRWGPFNLPIGGGGYFRILPYGWTRWGIRRLNDVERCPAIFYLHPWEIDPDQPRLRAPALGRFRHYFNLGKTEDRLRSLVREFRFSTMMTLLEGQMAERPADVPHAPLPYVW